MDLRANITIAAKATPVGCGGIGVVRISGPLVQKIMLGILGKNIKPRYAAYCDFLDEQQKKIDQGIAIYFSAPNSFTGEDVLELHGHGGPVVMHCLLQRVFELGAIPAKPGEFTERAFLNNKIDLIQAEGIADSIAASTHQAARNAMLSLQGELSNYINNLTSKLKNIRARIEAAIDFSDEKDIGVFSQSKIIEEIFSILEEIKKIYSVAKQGVIIRDGITAVFTGKPNAGKSSLLNALSGDDVAIVADTPGTTRDVLRSFIQIDGLPIHLMDTAGIHDNPDSVEKEGMRRAFQEIKKADHVLFVVDVVTNHKDDILILLNDFFGHTQVSANFPIIYNKIDLNKESPKIVKRQNFNCVYLSARTGAGIDLLRQHIKSFSGICETSSGFSARQRHLDSLVRVEGFLQAALNNADFGSLELVAEELRLAQMALGEITGEFTSENLLDKIFSEFCLGK